VCDGTGDPELVNRPCFCSYLEDTIEPPSALLRVTTGEEVACSDGFANEYGCSNVDLLSHLPLSVLNSASGLPDVRSNDCWGWTDPETGREYAIVCMYCGSAYVDITDPVNPIYLGQLLPTGGCSRWGDVKVYENHAFSVSESPDQGIQIFDLTQLRNVTEPRIFEITAFYDGVTSTHNVFINEDTATLYAVGSRTCAGGLHMVDIANPVDPTFLGCYSDDGYTHDTQCVVYAGPDRRYSDREICFGLNEDTVTILDVTNKSDIVLLSRTYYSNYAYTHQGWLTEDHEFLLFGDELDERRFSLNTTTIVFDVRKLTNPAVAGYYEHDTPAIDHNQYVKGR